MAKKESKPNIVSFYRSLAGLLLNEKTNALQKTTGPFPKQFLVTKQGVILECDKDKIVSICSADDMASAVSKFIDLRIPLEGYHWTAKQLLGFVDYWFYLAPRIEMPKSWAWKSDNSYTFQRLPWDGNETGATPLWDELLSRMSNSLAFKAFVGSLFDHNADRQQYLWLFGKGRNGKGTVLRFLKDVFGASYHVEVVPHKRDKFWTHGLLGKRLVAFGEIDDSDAGWPAGGFFKSLTGGDAIRMEIKGGSTFTSTIESKFIFAANNKPKINSSEADMRRAILCVMQPIENLKEDRGYEKALWDEGGAFLASCIQIYEEATRDRLTIPSDDDDLRNWVASLDDDCSAVLHDHFIVHPDTPSLVVRDKPHLSARDMARVLKEIFRTKPSDEYRFRRYLELTLGICRQTVQLGLGETQARFVNITVSPGSRLHLVLYG